MTNQQGAPEALAHELFTAAQLAPGEGISDAVARISALVEAQQPAPSAAAAPSVSDRERALHEIILNRLSHAELLEKAHYLMELNSNQARTIGELQDLVEAAPQPSHTPQADSVTAPAGGPIAWESTTLGYTKYITQSRYEMFSPAVRAWYKPYKCSNCATSPAQAADSVLEDAALSSEQQRAIFEAYESAASESYFEVRPQIDCRDRRKVFQVGFERGWDAARKQGGA